VFSRWLAERRTIVEVRIGVAALCANWFTDVGLRQDADIAQMVRADYARVVACLSGQFPRVIAPGVISTMQDAVRALAAFTAEGIDALVLVHLLWSEDQPLIAILEGQRDVPLLLWDYHPLGSLPPRLSVQELFRCSGTVGMLQGSAPMQRRGITAAIVAGAPGDPALARVWRGYATALRLRRACRGMRAGRIAGRCEVMTGTHVDADALRARLGITLVDLTASEYAADCDAVAPERIDALCAQLTGRHAERGVSEASLRLACRNSLAVDDVALRNDFRVVAMQDLDPELHRLVGIRPCLSPPECAARGVALAMESDVTTGVGMWLAMQAADSPALFTEIFTYDSRANLILMGHAAMHDPRLAAGGKVLLVPDAEYRRVDAYEGAWQEFIMRAGDVTCVSLYDTGTGYRLVTFEGQSQGAPRRLEGFAHAMVAPDVPVPLLLPRLVRRGMTQHFAVVPGRVSAILEKWCALSGVEFHQETIDHD
jgi:L-fucose isomerase-like protein